MISVIVPVYNVEDYLKECVDSILMQSYPDIEVILVDDGSTDSSGRLCDEYVKSDPRVRVIHKKNGGLSSARNAGIEAAKGEYISFVDSDDRIHGDFLRILYQACVENECKLAVCEITGTESKDISNTEKSLESAENKTPQKETTIKTKTISSNDLLEEFYGTRHNTITVAWNKLYHRSVIGDFRYPDGLVYEDEATTFAFIYYAGKVVWVDQKLYQYRNRTGSITKSGFDLRRLDVLEAYKRRRRFYLENKETTLASREEYCYLSVLLSFYDKVGRFLPGEKEKRKELRQEYLRMYRQFDKTTWGWKRRAFYRMCCLFPSMYARIKRTGRK